MDEKINFGYHISNRVVKWSPNYGQQFGASWTHICAPKPSVIKIYQQLIIKVGKRRLHGEHATKKTHKGCSKVIKSARKKGGVECFPPHNIIKNGCIIIVVEQQIDS